MEYQSDISKTNFWHEENDDKFAFSQKNDKQALFSNQERKLSTST